MKANELMIGSYIFVGKCHSNMDGDYDVFFNARPITIEDFKFWTENDWDKNDFNEFLAPIPLTPEILEKNGFVPNTHVYPYPYYEYINKKDKLKIGFAFPKGNKTSYKEPWVYIDSENVFIEHLPCIFVHQLQQFFRLCGLDDIANNFKV